MSGMSGISSRKQKLPGIVAFTAVLFTLAGFFHAIQGLGALIKKEYFHESSLLYSNLQVTGWVWVILGLLQIAAAYMIVGRASGGRILGIVLASLSAVVSFFTLGALPVWSIVLIAVDVLVIYGLTVHGDAFVPGGIEDGTVADPRPEPPGRPFA
jgi:hypothetical protein